MATRLKDKPLARNAGLAWQVTLYEDRRKTTPVDLTGRTLKCQLRADKITTATLLADVTVAAAADATTGVVDLSISKTVAAAIDAGVTEG